MSSTGKDPHDAAAAAAAADTVELSVAHDPRSCQELDDEFCRAAQVTAATTAAGLGEPERDWHDRTSARLAESRRRWEEEVRLMREQFFSAGGRPDNSALKERAAALLDAHTFDQLSTRTARRQDGRLGHRVRLDLRGFLALEDNSNSGGSQGVAHVTATVPASGQPRRVTVRVTGGCRELVRAVGLPAGCLPGSLAARVTADGFLLIDAVVDDSATKDATTAADRGSGGSGGRQVSTLAMTESAAASVTVSDAEDETPRVVERTDGVRQLRLQFRLGGGYRPEEVRVQVSDRRVRVTARHEERTRGRSFFREFQRDCDLPDEVDADSAAASLTTGGLLIVEAPLAAVASSAAVAAAVAAAAAAPVTVPGGTSQ